MRTAFVVLTYNRSEAVLAVLRALAPQCGPGHEVIVADDGSTPGHVQALRAGLPRFACPVRHVWHPDVGFTAARARNLGALHSTGDYVVFLDGDCIPSRHFVRAHEALAQEGCFVNGSRVLLDEALSAQVVQGTLHLSECNWADWLRLWRGGGINKLSHLACWPSAPGRVEREFRWKGIRSANLGVWLRDLRAVNGFDETFSGWGHEDADLVLRLHHAGLLRKNGWLATEVFHLWHRENARDREGHNRRRVEERMAGRVVRADSGLAEAASHVPPTVTELNP
jgi:glycosyltransferase involved in cell wall biosynthesis